MTGGHGWLESQPGWERWASTADRWDNRQGDTWWMDINSRAVQVHNNGLVSIHPDVNNSTEWFGDLLTPTGLDGDHASNPDLSPVDELDGGW